jgi:hypothetical protein
VEFLFEGQRIELNAMTSAQFIDWLEQKLDEHDVKKVVPNRDTLEAAYQSAILVRLGNEALAKVQSDFIGGAITEVPADLEAKVRSLLAENTKLSWDEVVKALEAGTTVGMP